ncbi:hypothetical protein Tco_0638977 [Tanacetum coccineum]
MNKPPNQAQQRKIICTYLENMEGKKPKDLKNKSFDSIRKMFDKAFKRVNIFVEFKTDLVEEKRYPLTPATITDMLNKKLQWRIVGIKRLLDDLRVTAAQIHAHLKQHERHANEVRFMHERNSDPLALVASHQMTQSPYQSHLHSYQNSQHQQFVSPYQSLQYGSPFESQQYSINQSPIPHSITYPPNNYQTSVYHNVFSPPSSIPQIEYSPIVNQQSEFSQLDSGLTMPIFKHGDDPIDAINHVISFLSAVVTSRYPTTNNQMRNSSNTRQQATINDGRVTVQLVKRRKISYATGEGHVSKQCTKPRRKQDDSWFKDKVLLVQAQASGQILHEEELAFLANLGIPEAQAIQTVITHNAAYQADDLGCYDSGL